MNRLARSLLASLFAASVGGGAAAPALGQAQPGAPAVSPPAAPPPPRGALWYDARQVGMQAAGPAFDNGPALQLACDYAAALVRSITPRMGAAQPVVEVVIPAATSPYYFKTPVWIEASGIRVRGGGPGTQLITAPGYCFPIFLCGLYRSDAPSPAPDLTFRPDAWNGGAPKLDSSVVTGPGQKWALRTKCLAYLVSQASNFARGGIGSLAIPDNWHQTPQFTVEVAVEGANGGAMPAGAYICGVGSDDMAAADTNGKRGAWVLRTTQANTYQLTLWTQARRHGPATGAQFTFKSGAATGKQGLAVQVDCTRGVVTALVNGVQVAVTRTRGTLTPGCSPNENHYVGFTVNAAGDGRLGGGTTDWTLWGCAISRSIRYATPGVGKAAAAHPQLWGSGGSPWLVVPGSAVPGGTFAVTIGGATSGPIPGNATAAQLQAALQAMPTVGRAITVASATLAPRVPGAQYQLAVAAGFPYAFGPGMCDGTNLAGQGLNDRYRYFPASQGGPSATDPYALGYLELAEDPTATPAPRHLTIRCAGPQGTARCSALLMTWPPRTQINYNAFSDLAMQTTGAYGVPLVLGRTLNTTVERCAAYGGTYGACNYPFGYTYYNRFVDCALGGSDAAFFGDSNLVTFEDIAIGANGRYAFRFLGCGVEMRGVRVGNYGIDPCGFMKCYTNGYGGTRTISDVQCDFEGGSISDAFVSCELQGAGGGNFTLLTLDGIVGSDLGAAPIFRLDGVAAPVNYPPGKLYAKGVQAVTTGPVVGCNSAAWSGEVRIADGNYGPWVAGDGSLGRPRVVVRSDDYQTPPRGGSWLSGTAKVDVPGPAEGQYRRLEVARDGVVGSRTPPRWAGLEAVPGDPDATLAAYALDHTAASAVLSGRATAWGRPTAYVAGVWAAMALFGNPTKAATFQLVVGGAGAGGTFAMSYGGQTTGPIAYSPTLAPQTIRDALWALTPVGVNGVGVVGPPGGPYTVNIGGGLALASLTNTAGPNLGFTVDGSGLTGGVATIQADPNNTWSIPRTFYAALQTTPAYAYNGVGAEPPASSGYARMPVPNTLTTFGASRDGVKASGAVITWAPLTQPITVRAITLMSGPASRFGWLTYELPEPIAFAAGESPTLTLGPVEHVPYPGQFSGGMTDIAWGRVMDAMFGGVPFPVPAAYYAAMSTTPVSRLQPVPAEPVGGGYARVALPGAASWAVTRAGDNLGKAGDVRNARPIAFAAGALGPLAGIVLMDDATAGEAWWVAPLVLPVTPVAGGAAPTFAAGALVAAPL